MTNAEEPTPTRPTKNTHNDNTRCTLECKEISKNDNESQQQRQQQPQQQPFVSANRLHKRRQRKRNQDKRQMDLEELMNRISSISFDSTSCCRRPLAGQEQQPPTPTPPHNVDFDDKAKINNITLDTIRQLYSSIPSITSQATTAEDTETERDITNFWNYVPDICNPNKARLNNIIADETKFYIDKKYQKKLHKKLQIKLGRGEITEIESKELWSKHGRVDDINNHNNDDDNVQEVSLLSYDRGQRKAWQIENFAYLLQTKFRDHERRTAFSGTTSSSSSSQPLTVVDFGCGSGNLCLALASYFTNIQFVLVDKKPYPLKLVERRANEAKLSNIHVMQYTFTPNNLNDFHIPNPSVATKKETTTDDYKEEGKKNRDFDIGIGLHCCGSFTDMVMKICLDRNADCIVCPCCNGAMTSQTTCGYEYPRSSVLRTIMTEDEYLQQLSKSADDLGNYDAKCLIEYDRALWAQENGFQQVELWKLNPIDCTPKHHVLCLKC